MSGTSVAPVGAEALTQSPAGHEPTRRDIQGLRALAVGIVVLGHLWPHRLPGGMIGVDVFFVISGFLITSHLLRRPPTDRATLFAFWARRIRRLLPAATVVLTATVLGALVWLPTAQAARTAAEAAAASVYGENWAKWLININPATMNDPVSPVQHYWSLSVEEQFYFIWPILLGLAILAGRRLRRENAVVVGVVGAIIAVSFLLSVWTTKTAGALGYFGTHVRMWELAIGGLVGLVMHLGLRAGGRPLVQAALSWAGLGMIGLSAVWIDQSTHPFPGPWAALPVLGTAIVIWADSDHVPWGIRRVVSPRPIQFVGDISYSVYLWHWPVIVFAPFVLPVDVNWQVRLVMGALMLVLGALTWRFVEQTLRYQRGIVSTVPRSYAMGATCITIVLVVCAAALAVTN